MKNKAKLFVFPLISLSMICSCSPTLDTLDGSKNKITIVFNAGDFTFKSNGSHALPIKVFRGTTWGYLKNNLDQKLVAGKPESEVFDFGGLSKIPTFTEWQYNGKAITDDIVFNTEDSVINAEFDMEVTVTLDAGESHTIWDGTSAEKTKVYTVKKNSTFKDLKDTNTIVVRDSAGTAEATDFAYFKNSKGTPIPTGSEGKYTFTKNETLTAHFSSPTTRTNDFTEDSWDVFLGAANSGLYHMKTKGSGINGGYKTAYDNNNGTFVGLKRKVKIGDIDYPVTVIGEDADNCGNQKCVLTFMFDNLISTNRSFTSSGQPIDNSYQASSLYDYLNNKFFYSLPAELQDSDNGIKRVDKFTQQGGGLDSEDKVVHKEKKTNDVGHKLFVPSLAELNIQNYKNGYAPGGKNYVEDEGVGLSHRYDSHYKYFDVTAEAAAKSRIRTPLIKSGEIIEEGEACSYWVRSPDVTTSCAVWTVDERGDISESPQDMSVTRGVCPCFCVGLEKSNINISFNPGDGEWAVEPKKDPITIPSNESNIYMDILDTLKKKINNKYPTKTGENFVGWVDDEGNLIDPTKEVTESGSFKAKYTKVNTFDVLLANDNLSYKYRFDPTKFTVGSSVKIDIFPLNYENNKNESIKMREVPPSIDVKCGDVTFKQGIDYSYTTTPNYGTLTIFSSATRNRGNPITITPSCSTLLCDWATIDEIAKKDEANQISKKEGKGVPGYITKRYFDYCDKKDDLKIDGFTYKVEIIDLGDNTKDKIAGSSATPGITFDFMTLPKTTTRFNSNKNSSFDYASNNNNRLLYNALNNFYDKAPNDFKKCVRSVTKHYIQPNSDNYKKPNDKEFQQYFFAPAFKELTNNNASSAIAEESVRDKVNAEGKMYEAYKYSGKVTNNRSLEKKIVGTETLANFWLRSGCFYKYYKSFFHQKEEAWYQYYVNYDSNGTIQFNANYQDAFRYMLPLFCI